MQVCICFITCTCTKLHDLWCILSAYAQNCVRYPVWQLVSPSAFSRRAVVSYWRKYVHEVLVNHLGGLSLPRKSVIRLTDRPNMTLDVYHGRKTTMQLQLKIVKIVLSCYTYYHLLQFFSSFEPLKCQESRQQCLCLQN